MTIGYASGMKISNNLSPDKHPARKIEWVDRGWYAVTEFERTPSINFKRAVEFAQTSPEFTPLMDERNVLIYRNIYREKQLPALLDMVKLIKNWKGAKLYIKGERVAFDMIGHGMQCYIQSVLKQQGNSTPGETCRIFSVTSLPSSGYIGCRRSGVRMTRSPAEPLDSPLWFAFGRLDRHQVYHIDKDDLESAVIGELIEYHYCPLLNLERLRTFVKCLPNKIDPRKDREWRYNRNHMQQKAAKSAQHSRRNPGAAREPDVLPVSTDAYEAYLRRKPIEGIE